MIYSHLNIRHNIIIKWWTNMIWLPTTILILQTKNVANIQTIQPYQRLNKGLVDWRTRTSWGFSLHIILLHKLVQPTCLFLAASSREKLSCNLRTLHQKIVGDEHHILTEDNIIVLCPPIPRNFSYHSTIILSSSYLSWRVSVTHLNESTNTFITQSCELLLFPIPHPWKPTCFLLGP